MIAGLNPATAPRKFLIMFLISENFRHRWLILSWVIWPNFRQGRIGRHSKLGQTQETKETHSNSGRHTAYMHLHDREVGIMHQPTFNIGYCQLKHMQPKSCTNKPFSSTSTKFNLSFGWYASLTPAKVGNIPSLLLDVLENVLLYMHLATQNQIFKLKLWVSHYVCVATGLDTKHYWSGESKDCA